MSDPFIGEVKIISFNFPPKGWAFCNGQTQSIQQNQALYSLLGTTYGGNGQTTFGLPNLQGCTPIGWGNGQGLPAVTLGQAGGEAAHTLTVNEMPAHLHAAKGSSAGATATSPDGAMLASTGDQQIYNQTAPNTALVAGTVGNSGNGQSHPNLQPYQVLNFVIALVGIYPSRS